MREIKTFLLALALLMIPASTHAQGSLSSHYKQSFTLSERVNLQSQLILGGFYEGTIDGAVGPQSIKAIRAFQASKGMAETSKLTTSQQEQLRQIARETSQAAGLTRFWDKRASMSYLVPTNYVDTLQHAEKGSKFLASSERLYMHAFRTKAPRNRMRRVFDQLRKNPETQILKAKWQGNGFFLIEKRSGHLLYTASRVKGSQTKNLVLMIKQHDQQLLQPVALLMTRLFFPFETKGLNKSALLDDAGFDTLQQDKPPAQFAKKASPKTPDPSGLHDLEETDPPENTSIATGSGFFVSHDGHIMTNAHVVNGCLHIRTARWGQASILHFDSTNDLAIIKLKRQQTTPRPLAIVPKEAKLGEEVMALGYPLQGLLAQDAEDMSITTGVISRLSGLGGSKRDITISAPVQPGNSGGPLINNKGNVVGVIVAKLNALAEIEENGNVPQNVNFAVNPITAQKALRTTGIDASTISGNQDEMDRVDLIEQIRKSVTLITCYLKPEE